MVGRGSLLHDPQPLAPLVDKTDFLTLKPNGRVGVVDKLAPTLDEYGVPQRVQMVRAALATLALEHEWTGGYDLHHLAYEGETYRGITGPHDERIGSEYRGAALLKVVLPRLLHEYMHAIFETPPVPDYDVMRQFGREANCVHNLFNTVRVGSYDAFPHLRRLPHARQEAIRHSQFLSKLEHAVEPQLGVVPDHEQLSRMSIVQARQTLRLLARATGFSNVPSCQRVFFGEKVML